MLASSVCRPDRQSVVGVPSADPVDGSVSAERGPAHWLLVDRDRNRAWVAI